MLCQLKLLKWNGRNPNSLLNTAVSNEMQKRYSIGNDSAATLNPVMFESGENQSEERIAIIIIRGHDVSFSL